MSHQPIVTAELYKQIQFTYELAFAKLELKSMGVNFNLNLDDKIRFELIPSFNESLLLKKLAYFEKIGNKKTDYSEIITRNITRSPNQYLTHWYYPYKGKFHPQIIRAIINIIGIKSDQILLDPFVGSGTSVLEAHLLGINSIGIDISPICILQSNVKITAGEVAEQLSKYRDKSISSMKKDFDNLENVLRYNGDYKGDEYKNFLNSIENENIRDFYYLAQLIFASDIGRRRRTIEYFQKNLDKMICSAKDLSKFRSEKDWKFGKVELKQADSRSLPIKSESINGIVTSPPYSIALDYVKNDLFALKILGNDIEILRDNCIGVRGKGTAKLNQYTLDMEKCYSEMYRVLHKDGQCVIIIGEAKYDGVETKTVENTIDFCEGLGFKLIRNIPKIIFGLYNTIKDENVLFFKK